MPINVKKPRLVKIFSKLNVKTGIKCDIICQKLIMSDLNGDANTYAHRLCHYGENPSPILLIELRFCWDDLVRQTLKRYQKLV